MSKLEQLKQAKRADNDLPKLMKWLAYIGEKDPVCITEVVDQFKSDPGAREYYLGRYREVYQPEPIDQRAKSHAKEHNTVEVIF